MNKTKRLLAVLGVAIAVIAGIAATDVPTRKSVMWEYRVIRESVGAVNPLTVTLNQAGGKGWTVDSFSTHSTGNSEVGVVILKRQIQTDPSK